LTEVLSFAVKGLGQDGEASPADTPTVDHIVKNLIHFVTPTLPHFIALLCHPSPSFPSQNTNLIIIDSLSTLIASAYPKTIDNNSTPRKLGVGNVMSPK
jgi:hypothetical protein